MEENTNNSTPEQKQDSLNQDGKQSNSNKKIVLIVVAIGMFLCILATLLGLGYLYFNNNSDSNQRNNQENQEEMQSEETEESSEDVEPTEDIEEMLTYTNDDLPNFSFMYLESWDVEEAESIEQNSNNLPLHEIIVEKEGVELNIRTSPFSVGGWIPQCYLKSEMTAEQIDNEWYRLENKVSTESLGDEGDIFYTKDFDTDEEYINSILENGMQDPGDYDVEDYIGCGVRRGFPLFTEYSEDYDVQSPVGEGYKALISLNIEGEENVNSEILEELDEVVLSIEN